MTRFEHSISAMVVLMLACHFGPVALSLHIVWPIRAGAVDVDLDARLPGLLGTALATLLVALIVLVRHNNAARAELYSWRSASIGFSRAARRAGK